jgi:hypothetical protein
MKEFNSQICTSREQSERLLALGLKKETADMYYRFYDADTYEVNPTWETIWEDRNDYKKIIPAWSLHRLIEMVAGGSEEQMIFLPDPYDELIEEIAGAIMVGCFPKEYLV